MRRTAIKPSMVPMKRTPLKSIGRKARSKRTERQHVVDYVHTRDQTCRFPSRAAAMTGVVGMMIPVGMCSVELDVHEIIPRSAWPDGELVADNCVLVCRSHHIWIDYHPEPAHAMGLHGYSWERPT